jgi:hypothetical protein
VKRFKIAALLAGVLVGGLVLGGIGVASATMGAGMPGTPGTHQGSMLTTPPVDPSDGTTMTPGTPWSGDTTMTPGTHGSDGATMTPSTPWSEDTTMTPGTHGSDGATMTPDPTMPPQAMGPAYGRTIPHPHTGLHRGKGHKHAAKHLGASTTARSMMGR